MTCERAQQLAGFDLPELDRLIKARRSEGLAIGRKGKPGYIIEMAVEDATQAARPGFPEADGLVGAARSDQPPVGAKGDGTDVVEVAVLNNQLRFRRLQRGGLRAHRLAHRRAALALRRQVAGQ